MANANELLTQNIEDWKDVREIQNQVTLAQYGSRHGLYVIEWNVEAEMAIQGVAALAIGTYYLKAPQKEASANSSSWDRFFIPAGTLLKTMWVHTHQAKVGSGTITPFIGAAGATNLTAINAAGHNDDTAALVAGDIIVADADFGVVIASNTVTAGGFTVFLEYYLGNVG
jgi:hypothetical protein